MKKIYAYVGALALTGGIAYATSLPASADWDPTTLETTVAQHSSQIDTLNAKVDGNTQDITGLKNATTSINVRVDSLSAGPADTPTAAPSTVSQPVPSSALFPQPPVVTASTKTVLTSTSSGSIGDEANPPTCHYTYDDGSSADVPATITGGIIFSCQRPGSIVPR